MRKIHATILAACVAIGASSAYAQQAAVAPSNTATTQARTSAKTSDVEALALMSKGDNWAGTNALKALLAKSDTPMNRFNLATGYQRTGRIDQAQSLYQGLLTKGRTTTAVATPSKGAGGVRVFNLADESASRLAYIGWLKSDGGRHLMTRATNQLPVSAKTLGVEASARVGGPTSGDVSDEKAMALDGLARGATQ